jgi:O-antigen ligase
VNVAATLPGPMAAWRDPASWAKASDIVAVLIALSLPFSTSLVGVLAVVFVLTVAPTIERRAFGASLRRPVSALPITLFALALVGMLWSDAPWGARSHALGPLAKFLVLPLLVYHFERSARGMWVLTGFLTSCILMMVMSWLVTLYPGLALKNAERGIFVKNYIDQSQEFALCAIVLAYPVYTLLRNGRIWQALLLAVIAMNFNINMAFVIVSRTAMVTLPVMMGIFALLHLQRRASAIIIGMMILLAGLPWMGSPQLRQKIDRASGEYQLYKEQNKPNEEQNKPNEEQNKPNEEQNKPSSAGLRLEFWQKSLRFFAEAPVIGHGTGSTRGLFERASVGTEDIAHVIDNPHNQTLNVAVQWGIVGVVILYAMWLMHLLLFRGEGLIAWTGMMVVLQNVLSSLFNSHLFDFHEGWMYVLGVGVAAGMTLRANENKTSEDLAAR